MVARDGIEPPTPAFSGLGSGTRGFCVKRGMGASQKGREEQVSAILGALVLAAVPARLDTGAHSEPVVKRGSEVT